MSIRESFPGFEESLAGLGSRFQVSGSDLESTDRVVLLEEHVAEGPASDFLIPGSDSLITESDPLIPRSDSLISVGDPLIPGSDCLIQTSKARMAWCFSRCTFRD